MIIIVKFQLYAWKVIVGLVLTYSGAQNVQWWKAVFAV